MMNENDSPRERDISVLDYLRVLYRWRYFIGAVVLGAAILTAGITLLIPNRYKSTARLLPPSKGLNLPGNLGQIAREFLPLSGMGNLQASQESFNYLAILQSYTATKALVEKFNLSEVYDIQSGSLERTMKAVREFLEFNIEKEGTITVTVWDVDPQRAADMCNFLVETLNGISIDLATREARNNREFLETRVEITKEALRQKEDSLKAYQEKTGTMLLPESVSSGVSAVAEIYVMKAKKEIELGVLERVASADNPMVQQLRVELEELNERVSKIPETGLQSLRLLRDVLIHQKILEFIVPLYEQARIDEHKEVPVILVLDQGVPAEIKDTPRRTIIVLAVSVFFFILSILFILFVEAYVSWSGRAPERSVHPMVPWLRKVFRVS